MAAEGTTVTIRHDLRPGDLGRVAEQHGVLYAEEYGFDQTFEAYVAQSLAEFGLSTERGRSRLWLAERDGRLVGSIGMVGREGGAAQLRWMLVSPQARGGGLGGRLIAQSLAFCRDMGATTVYLWTVHVLSAAARLYTAAGFRLTEQRPLAALWGTTLAEQRYDLTLYT